MLDQLLNWRKWGGFGITGIGLLVLAVLLLVGSITNIEQANFVQKVVIYVLGTAIIGYAHNLAHSTQKNWQEGNFKDLTPRAQAIAIAAHTIWFLIFIGYSLATSDLVTGSPDGD